MSVSVILGEAEIRLAKFIGKRRWENNRKEGVEDRQMGPQPPEFIDANGFAGELAAAKHYNVYPDMTLSTRKGGYDLLINGQKFDVKTTHYKDGKMLISLKENHEVDVYLLVRGDYTAKEPRFEIFGTIPFHTARDARFLGDLGWGRGYVIPPQELDPVY